MVSLYGTGEVLIYGTKSSLALEYAKYLTTMGLKDFTLIDTNEESATHFKKQLDCLDIDVKIGEPKAEL